MLSPSDPLHHLCLSKFSSFNTQTVTVEHHTGASKWACTRREFLLIRFLIHKHIVSYFEKFPDPPRLFSDVRRKRHNPFWMEKQLIIHPEHRIEALDIPEINDDLPSDSDPNTDNESDGDVEAETEGDKHENTDNNTSSDDSDDALSLTSANLDIPKEQK